MSKVGIIKYTEIKFAIVNKTYEETGFITKRLFGFWTQPNIMNILCNYYDRLEKDFVIVSIYKKTFYLDTTDYNLYCHDFYTIANEKIGSDIPWVENPDELCIQNKLKGE